MRIAIAGFQHETNTFVTAPTGLAEFEQADSWPALLTGIEVVEETRGMNLPIAGFIEAAKDAVLAPILWCAAEPGGRVSNHAYEVISARILNALADMGSVDAVYLDLHGAMVTESFEDGEGTLLQQVRERIGLDMPLIASLDLHANVTAAMVEAADALTVFRSYPHLDMAQTGARSYDILSSIMHDGPLAKARRQCQYLIPLHAQHTGSDPAQGLYDSLNDIGDGQNAEIALGFTAADIFDTGPSILAYARTQEHADGIADDLLAQLERTEPHFDCALMSPAQAVSQAIKASENGTVVIADVQDNPGAGGSSDTTGLLRELIKQNAPDAMIGLIHDPALAAEAHVAGQGGRFDASIGGRGPGDSPLRAAVHIERLSDGNCTYSGEMYGGGVGTLGPAAALRVDGTQIRIVVTSVRNQCLDLAHFRHFGLFPETARIVCVKSTAHFRADFDPIAHETLLVAAPGQFPCVLEDLSFANLRSGVRLGPMGPMHNGDRQLQTSVGDTPNGAGEQRDTKGLLT